MFLFRRNSIRLCAAKPAPPKAEAAVAAPVADAAAAGKKGRVAKEVTPFRVMPLHAWQTKVAGANATELLPSLPLLFHGATLGPRPLIVLGGAQRTADTASQSASKFSPMLSQLQWQHGAIHISFDFDTTSPDALSKAADAVATVLDVLGVGWTHVVGHSAGALLAAKVAFQHPTRVGTIVSLDSPLVESKWIDNARTREELFKAREDVNVPQSMIDFTQHSLEENIEAPMPRADSTADDAFYQDYLFAEKHLFREGKTIRDDSRYLSLTQLQCLKFPLQFITPAQGAVLDVETHKSFFGIRRLQPVKSAASHSGLFESGAADEVANMLEQWVNRFEPDVIYAKRFEQSAKDMRMRMDGAAAGAATGGAAEKAPQQFPAGKKKEQKKKK